MSEQFTATNALLVKTSRDKNGGSAKVKFLLTPETMTAFAWPEMPTGTAEWIPDVDELQATVVELTPNNPEMKSRAVRIDARSIGDFMVQRKKKKTGKNSVKGDKTITEVVCTIRFTDPIGCAKLEQYIQSAARSEMLICYSPAPSQEELPGTRVDMTPVNGRLPLGPESAPKAEKPAKPKSGCKNCDAGIPKKDNDDAEHVNGEPCKLWDVPLNPAPPMQTAVLINTVPAHYEPTTEFPNDQGVYTCDPTFFLERKCGKVFGKIETLMISEADWASALTVEDSKRTRAVEPLTDFETFSSLDVAIAIKAFAGEKIARAEINHHKGAAAVSWLEMAGWFQEQWTSRRGTLAFETVEDWAVYLEGMLDGPEPVEAAS